LATRVVAGDRAALARAITRLERDPAAAGELDAALAAHGGRSYTVGITGAPGAGKSTLVGALLREALLADRRVAVLALDPSSPLTRGAILGDRLRMDHAAGDARVFVRSMTADPGSGGLSLLTPLVLRALDAAGWPCVLLETVGVGQVELDVAEAAATTVVVLNPGWGDEIQATKAGLMEVADIFVLNKCDRPGAEESRRDLEQLAATVRADGWQPPVICTRAHEGQGVAAVWEAVAAHRRHLEENGGWQRWRERFVSMALQALLRHELERRVARLAAGAGFRESVARLARGEGGLHAVRDAWLASPELAPGR